MKTVVITSMNPVKIDAVRIGFSEMFPGEKFSFEGTSIPSDVSDQPMSDEETLRGAYNRVLNGKKKFPFSEFCVGIEGGIERKSAEMMAFAWVVITSGKVTGKARTGTFQLPPQVAAHVASGMELGEADCSIFSYGNSGIIVSFWAFIKRVTHSII